MKDPHIAPALVALGFAALAVVAAVYVPPTFLDKLGQLLEKIAEDPAGATVIVSVIAGAVTTLRAAWVRRPPGPPAPPSGGSAGVRERETLPPTVERRGVKPENRHSRRFGADALRAFSLHLTVIAHSFSPILGPMLFVAVLATGCGASALQTHATIAVSMEAGLGASRVLLAPACEAALTSCADAACAEHVATDCRTAVASWEVTHAAVIGYVEALQAASLADEGSILDALAMVLATTTRTWAATVAALATVGVTLPAIPDTAAPLLAAIGGGL